MNDKTLQLFNNCFIINGFLRSVIYDGLYEKYYIVPKSMIYFLANQKKYFSQNNKRDKKLDVILKEYKEFVIKNKIGLMMSPKERALLLKFPFEFNHPSKISNIIVMNTWCINRSLLKTINKLNSEAILFKFDEIIQTQELEVIIQNISETSITHIEIIIDNVIADEKESLFELFKKYKKINRFICKGDKAFFFKTKIGRTFRIINEKLIFCGKISSSSFANSFYHFIESQKYNSCLNRKVCIDINGEIKNCPFMNKSYGNIRNIKLNEAIEKPGFKDLWLINKDKIDVCKDCEFRHLCTDCRTFIKDPENIYSQPSKCTYNPYIAKWADEDGYIPVEECGIYSKEKGFVTNKQKINKINKNIWKE